MTYGPLLGTRMAKCKATFEGVHVVLKVQPHPLEIQTKTWLLPRLLVKSQLAPESKTTYVPQKTGTLKKAW